jgi:hypothetical protein
VQAWSFLQLFQPCLELPRLPSLAELEAAIATAGQHSSAAVPNDPAPPNVPDDAADAVDVSTQQEAPFQHAPLQNRRAPFEATIIALLQLLMQDIYHVCMSEYVDEGGDHAQRERDMAAGLPVVDSDTWPHAASAILAGAPSPTAVLVTSTSEWSASCLLLLASWRT